MKVHRVIFAQLVNFACFSSRLLIFFPQSNYSKKSLRITIRKSNSFDPGQDQHFVGPDMGLNCLQRYSADEMIRPSFILQYSSCKLVFSIRVENSVDPDQMILIKAS